MLQHTRFVLLRYFWWGTFFRGAIFVALNLKLYTEHCKLCAEEESVFGGGRNNQFNFVLIVTNNVINSECGKKKEEEREREMV